MSPTWRNIILKIHVYFPFFFVCVFHCGICLPPIGNEQYCRAQTATGSKLLLFLWSLHFVQTASVFLVLSAGWYVQTGREHRRYLSLGKYTSKNPVNAPGGSYVLCVPQVPVTAMLCAHSQPYPVTQAENERRSVIGGRASGLNTSNSERQAWK